MADERTSVELERVVWKRLQHDDATEATTRGKHYVGFFAVRWRRTGYQVGEPGVVLPHSFTQDYADERTGFLWDTLCEGKRPW